MVTLDITYIIYLLYHICKSWKYLSVTLFCKNVLRFLWFTFGNEYNGRERVPFSSMRITIHVSYCQCTHLQIISFMSFISMTKTHSDRRLLPELSPSCTFQTIQIFTPAHFAYKSE